MLIELLIIIILLLLYTIQSITITEEINFNGNSNPSSSTSWSKKQEIEHDSNCFTQGLLYSNGYLYESCGLYGKSSVRKVHPDTGELLLSHSLPKDVFAEGITIVSHNDDKGNAIDYIYVLTWRGRRLFILEKESLTLKSVIHADTFNGEGWGLTINGKNLIASDGSSKLTFFEIPSSLPSNDQRLTVVKHLEILDEGKPVTAINELEFVNGHIYANIWYKDVIIRMDQSSGNVISKYDMHVLYPKHERVPHADCLNGIAYNETNSMFLVTGKQWPHYYVIDFQ